MAKHKKKEFSFKFKTPWENNSYIPENIGRIALGDGSIIRLVFTPQGLKAVIPKKSKSIIFYENQDSQLGFIEPRKRK